MDCKYFKEFAYEQIALANLNLISVNEALRAIDAYGNGMYDVIYAYERFSHVVPLNDAEAVINEVVKTFHSSVPEALNTKDSKVIAEVEKIRSIAASKNIQTNYEQLYPCPNNYTSSVNLPFGIKLFITFPKFKRRK